MKKTIAAALLLLLSFLFAGKVSANAGPIAWDGSRGTEPTPLEDCPIQVEKEQLEFKLESWQYGWSSIRSKIRAEYSLYNPTGENYSLTAVFPVITGEGDEQDPLFQKVRLDGKEIPYKIWVVAREYESSPADMINCMSLEEMLDCRQPFTPDDTHFLHGPYPLLLLEFEAELPPGKTRLEIISKTTAFMERDTVWHYVTTQTRYTFHYFLSPAQYWAEFKNLNIVLKTSSAAPVLKESSLDFHWAGWRRYRFHSDSLPEEELIFMVQQSLWYTPARWGVVLCLAADGMIIWRRLRYKR